MNGRWAICIDIEGFSENYEYSEDRKTFAICALAELMGSIYKIATRCYPGNPDSNYSDRLFVHQFGDGFFICSDFPEKDASKAVSISVALMRNMIIRGYATKAAVSVGDTSDIKGCYPKPMRDSNDHCVDLGMGLMTFTSVMGTAFTRAHKLAGTHKGAVLILDKELLDFGLPQGAMIGADSANCIDWISSDLVLANDISDRAGLSRAGAGVLLGKLGSYCKEEPVPPDQWIEATFSNIEP